jgi:hypothetical protein
MNQTVIFPDAVALIVEAFHRVPDPRPSRFVTVSRTGGPRRTVATDEPQITLDAWADDAGDAADLIQTARGILHAMARETVDGVAVYRVVEFAGPIDLPDELNTPQHRYTLTAAVHLRYSTIVE